VGYQRRSDRERPTAIGANRMAISTALREEGQSGGFVEGRSNL